MANELSLLGIGRTATNQRQVLDLLLLASLGKAPHVVVLGCSTCHAADSGMLTHRTRATLVQTLQALSQDGVRLLLLKHLNWEVKYPNLDTLLEAVSEAGPDKMAGILVELLGNATNMRAYATTKHIYDSRLTELQRCMRADGLRVTDDSLVQLLPTAEPAARIADDLDTVLSQSDLDKDGEVRRLLRGSYENASAMQPDFNGATTKARIALETVARRSAPRIALQRRQPAPPDNWGAALSFLRAQEVITAFEEQAFAKAYTLISTGVHEPVPDGLTQEQWTLLARTFAVASTYFLTLRNEAVRVR